MGVEISVVVEVGVGVPEVVGVEVTLTVVVVVVVGVTMVVGGGLGVWVVVDLGVEVSVHSSKTLTNVSELQRIMSKRDGRLKRFRKQHLRGSAVSRLKGSGSGLTPPSQP